MQSLQHSLAKKGKKGLHEATAVARQRREGEAIDAGFLCYLIAGSSFFSEAKQRKGKL